MTLLNHNNNLITCLGVISKAENIEMCKAIVEYDFTIIIRSFKSDMYDSFKKLLISKLIEIINDNAPIEIINKFAENIIQAFGFVDDEVGIVIPTTVNCLVKEVYIFNYFYNYGVVKYQQLYFCPNDYIFQTELTRIIDAMLTSASNDERLLWASILKRPH